MIIPLLPALLTLAGCQGHPRAGPDLLLVTVDTLRADHLGTYGYARPTSPVIDGLAARGLRFDRVLSPRGATWPALTSLHTSTLPVEHGVRENMGRMRPGLTSLAEVLAGQGYHTAAFLTNAAEVPWSGFQERHREYREPRDLRAAQAAATWLATAPEPWFLWVHLMSPHDPYVGHADDPDLRAPVFQDPAYGGPVSDAQDSLVRGMLGPTPFTEADQAELVARYDEEVAYADAQIGTLLSILEQRGLSSRTLVAVAADHGEELGEHQGYLFHFASAYDGVLHVPLVLSQPGVLPQGRVVASPASLIDLAPTLVELLGVSAPAGWRGRSLRPAVEGRSLAELPVHAELGLSQQVVYEGHWAYLHSEDLDPVAMVPPAQLHAAGLPEDSPRNAIRYPPEALWDLSTDPHQQGEQSARNPAQLRHMRQIAADFRRDAGWPGAAGQRAPGLSAADQRALEALGYMAPGASPGASP